MSTEEGAVLPEHAGDAAHLRRGRGDPGGSDDDARGAGASVDNGSADDFRAHVLIVDDDQVDRMAVRRHLAVLSARVTMDEADGVLAAIDRLAAEHFDCVLLDYNLPDGDGLTFLRGMRTASLDVPVVMLTGQDDAEVARDLILAGAAVYLAKSRLSSGELHAAIREAVRQHS